MKHKKVMIGVVLLCIGAAGLFFLQGAKTVEAVCFRNAPHERMSDGKIIKLCSCVDKRIKAANLSEAETAWVLTLLNDEKVKNVPLPKEERLAAISKLVAYSKKDCETAK